MTKSTGCTILDAEGVSPCDAYAGWETCVSCKEVRCMMDSKRKGGRPRKLYMGVVQSKKQDKGIEDAS